MNEQDENQDNNDENEQANESSLFQESNLEGLTNNDLNNEAPEPEAEENIPEQVPEHNLNPRAILEEEMIPVNERIQHHPQQPQSRRRSFFRLGYTELSLYSAFLVLWYTLRTRREFFPAVVYLSSSKLSYIIFGNALAALALSIFQLVCNIFLGGLRSAEREAIRDGMRWSMTETCLALTMFREEVSMNMGAMFLILIMGKCWHWAVELRGKHLIQTEEAFVLERNGRLRVRIPWSHIKYVLMVIFLSAVDGAAIAYCIWHFVDNGPSVLILFGFEGVILGISAFTALNLYYLHFLDGFVNSVAHTWPNFQPFKYFATVWRDYRLTLNLSADLVSCSAKFLSYLLFFFIVFTYYGMPFNIFREVYISCLELRKKMIQFASYRKLSNMMDSKFHTCTTDEELEEAGGVCIICRDALLVAEKPKKLPGCGHVFHKYCLKGWLMQQNSCPTCRRDIMAAVNEEARLASVDQLQQPQEVQEQDVNNDTNDQPEPDFKQETSTPERPHYTTLEENLPPLDPNTPPTLPALYKVTNPLGAKLVESRTRRTLILRIIPVNKIVICTHVQTWKIDDKDVMMLLMPDGWICSEDVNIIRSIPLPKVMGVERDVMVENTGITAA